MASWIAVVLLAVSADVELTPLGAPPVRGSIAGWTQERIVLATDEGERTFDTPRVQSLKFAAANNASGNAPGSPAAATGDVVIQLLDGSQLRARTYQAKAGKATGQLSTGGDFDFRTRSVRSVRFRPPAAELDDAWNAQLDARATGDLIVIRKAPKGSNKVTLDRQSGIVQEVTAETVLFELDGDRIPVKRERLEGVVYFQSSDRELPEAFCRLEDIGGSIWNVRTLNWEAGRLRVETAAGATATLTVDQLARVDFSVGNVEFLSDIEPDAVELSPFVESRSPLQTRFLQPRRDVAAGGRKLATGGESFDKGMQLHSRTQIVYRVPKSFRRFEARVGIADQDRRELGDVRLVISGDGKSLFDATITGTDPPLDVALDLTGVRRITLLVDFGANGDTADSLVLGNARMTK